MNLYAMIFIHITDVENNVSMLSQVKDKSLWLCWLGQFQFLILTLRLEHEKYICHKVQPMSLNTTWNNNTTKFWFYYWITPPLTEKLYQIPIMFL